MQGNPEIISNGVLIGVIIQLQKEHAFLQTFMPRRVLFSAKIALLLAPLLSLAPAVGTSGEARVEGPLWWSQMPARRPGHPTQAQPRQRPRNAVGRKNAMASRRL